MDWIAALLLDHTSIAKINRIHGSVERETKRHDSRSPMKMQSFSHRQRCIGACVLMSDLDLILQYLKREVGGLVFENSIRARSAYDVLHHRVSIYQTSENV